MKTLLKRANLFFDLPLNVKSRVLIIVAVALLLTSLWFPIWNMSFTSNQYTDGLELQIYSYQLEGGKSKNRDDLREINSLNHYIGMRPLLESDFSEFTWLPLAIGFMAILSLRAAVIGRMNHLIDVFVLFVYFSLFSLWSFYHRMYMYGHNLDPTASFKVPPFTPPVFGAKQIANFHVTSYPDLGSYAFFAFAILMALAIFFSRKERQEDSSDSPSAQKVAA